MVHFSAALLLFSCASPPPPAPERPEPYLSDIARRVALGSAEPAWVYDLGAFEPLGMPQSGDWLEDHPEPGQTVEVFVAGPRPTVGGPLVLAPIASEVDLQPLAEILEAWISMDVEVREFNIEVAGLPGRIRADTNAPQLYTPRLLELLQEKRPEGAFGVLGVTTIDLAPDESWNFVFGMATYVERVGVFSSARQQPPGTTDLQALRRAAHTLDHEALHMLGVHHCPYFSCAMNGSNSLSESDDTPMSLCPVCLRKLEMATGVDPVERYRRLAEVYERYGLIEDAAWVRARLARALAEIPG